MDVGGGGEFSDLELGPGSGGKLAKSIRRGSLFCLFIGGESVGEDGPCSDGSCNGVFNLDAGFGCDDDGDDR